MNSANHHNVIRLAIQALPQRSRLFWEPLESALLETCMLPDAVAIPLLNGEDGPWRRYFPAEVPKHSFEKHGNSARAHVFDIRFYIASIVAAIQHDSLDEACRFLGVLSHCLADFAEPAHYCEDTITLLLPPPPDMANCNPHRMIEDVPAIAAGHTRQARPLGDSVETVVMRVEGRLRPLYEHAMGTIVPMLNALYRKDIDRAARHAGAVLTDTAGVMGDILHTVYCMHTNNWTDVEKKNLRSCRLDDLEPVSYDVEFNYGHRPIRGAITIDQLGTAIPLRLRISQGGRPTWHDVEGLCMVPHALPIKGTAYLSSVAFDLPRGVFNRFTASIGLLAGVCPQAVCRFAVEGDGQVLFESPPIQEADTAQRIRIDISDTRHLRLMVHTDGSTNKLAFPIWAWPTVSQEQVETA